MTLPAEPLDPRLMAHLAHLITSREPLLVVDAAGLELEAFPVALEADRRRLVLSIPSLPPHALSRPERLTLALPAGGQRWEGPSRWQLRVDRTHVAVEIPRGLHPANRRQARRIAPGPEDGLRALVRVGRTGPTLTGPVVDLSSGGLCMRLERALDRVAHVRLDPRSLGLEPGAPLDLVELTGLREESLEAAGLVREVEASPEGPLRLRIQLRGLLRADRAFLAAWIQAHPSPSELPWPGLG